MMATQSVIILVTGSRSDYSHLPFRYYHNAPPRPKLMWDMAKAIRARQLNKAKKVPISRGS